MFPKPILSCPVCETTLGYFTKGAVSSFACTECQWIFTWDKKGKLQPPTKIIPLKKPAGCDCGSCEYRDEQKRLKNIQGN